MKPGPTPEGPAGAGSPRINEVGIHTDAVAELIERARATVPFYAEHLAGTGATELSELPTFNKADLSGHGRFPLLAVPLAECYRVSATSGTTGPPLFFGYDEADWADVHEQYAHIGRTMELRDDDTLLNMLGGGLWVGSPSLEAFAHANDLGLVSPGPTGPDQLFDWLGDMPVTLLAATPSYMRLLVEKAQAEGIDLAAGPLRMGLLGGEGATPALRRRVVDAMGPDFVWQELYGSTETGGPVLGWGPPSDPLAGHLLINTWAFVVEILHTDRDEPVPPGEVGEITITAPYRRACPLIRYRTRDLARTVDTVDPSGFPRISSLVGRIDDALKVRGALVYPSVVEEIAVEHLEPGAEWRIHLTRDVGGLDVMRIEVEHRDADFIEELGRIIHHRIKVRPRMEMVEPGSLERFAGKAKRVKDDRPRD